MNRSWSLPLGIAVVLFVLTCCACLFIILGVSLVAPYFTTTNIKIPVTMDFFSKTATPTPIIQRPTAPVIEVIPPTPVEATQTPEATAADTPEPVDTPEPAVTSTNVVAAVPTDTLNTLETNDVPINDLYELAGRFKDIWNIPQTMEPPKSPFQVGATQNFYVTNVDTNETRQISANLSYVTDHAYFWFQDGVSYNNSDLRNLANVFENKIYPTDREFFGSEWTPGIDGDVHLYIVFARDLGSSLLGYFSSADEVPPQAHKYSNAHEMFLLNADNIGPGSEETASTIAHEFQHMIHWYRDRNEESWMNEGFSVLAEFLNKYPVYFDYAYVQDPDVQLTDWASQPDLNSPHYGMSFLFLDYFLNRFGDTATKALVADTENGLVSVDHVLKEIKALDPLTHKQITADNVFTDWAVASYLQDGSVADGRYTYQNYPGAPKPSETEKVATCPLSDQTRDVHQYGVDYILVTCPGDYTLHFEGSTIVQVVPVQPHSGKFYFWSNKGDESDMTLTKEFDFSSHTSGPLTFDYWTWYDVEKDYDYVYLDASTDGKNWEILKTPSCTTNDPSGNSYGCGYNAESGGGSNARWIEQKVDLSKYNGKKVQLRFDYITDAAVNGEGLLLDDMSIPEINYSSDFEKDDGGWVGKGFVRIENELPQTFGLELISQGRKTTVENIPLNPDMTADIPIHIGGDVDQAVLVVSGTTRFTRLMATYRYNIRK